MADVARGEPPVRVQHPGSFLWVAPITVHHALAADHDLAVGGDPNLGVLDRRAHGFEPDAGGRPIAADHRGGFGLAVALEERDSERLEEDPDVGIERRSARNPGLRRSEERRVGEEWGARWS